MRWKIAAVLVVTFVCLLWVLREAAALDLATVLAEVEGVRWERFPAVFALYLVTHGLRVIRLRWILGRPIAFLPLFSILSIGYFAINVMPFRMGELVRPFLMTDREGIPWGTGIASIFVERLVDVLALLTMLWLCVFVVELPPGAVMVEGTDIVAVGQRFAGVIVVAGTVGLLTIAALGDRALRWTDRLPLGGVVRRFVEGLRDLVRRPVELAKILGLTVFIWLVTIWSVQVSLSAFPGLPTDLSTALVVWTATLAGMSAVPTPGFFGGFEAFCAGGLIAMGVTASTAWVFAVVLHLGQFGFTVGCGIAFMAWEGLSLQEVITRSRTRKADGAPPG